MYTHICVCTHIYIKINIYLPFIAQKELHDYFDKAEFPVAFSPAHRKGRFPSGHLFMASLWRAGDILSFLFPPSRYTYTYIS